MQPEHDSDGWFPHHIGSNFDIASTLADGPGQHEVCRLQGNSRLV